MFSEPLSGPGVDHRSGPDADAGTQESAGVTGGDEADVVRVGLGGQGETTRGRLSAHLGLRRRRTEREHGVGELLGGENTEHVGLVLCPGGGAVQFAAAVIRGHDRRVVAGRDRVEAERERLLEQGRELDALVAAHARVGGATGGVLGHEVIDHVGLEALGEVPYVVRNADDVGRALGIHRILDGAAPAGTGAQRAGVAAEGEVHPDDVVAGVDRARGGDGGVHSSAHGCQYAHGYQV